jgi:hypothetical protein
LDETGIRDAVNFDTNVVSLLARNEIPNFVPEFLSHDVRPAVSDSTLHELEQGNPGREKYFMAESGFFFLRSSEPLFLDGKANFYTKFDSDAGDPGTERLEGFPGNLMRSIA